MNTVKQLIGLTSQFNEIMKRVGNGSLGASDVKMKLQSIIEGRWIVDFSDDRFVEVNYPLFNPPSWWRTCGQQLQRARELWPDAALPTPPASFEPETDTEVLLLHVPDVANRLWRMIEPPDGYELVNDSAIGNVSLFGPRYFSARILTGPVWLAFDPEGEHRSYARGESFAVTPAATEAFSALVQFPDWIGSMSTDRLDLEGFFPIHSNDEDVWYVVLKRVQNAYLELLTMVGRDPRLDRPNSVQIPTVRML